MVIKNNHFENKIYFCKLQNLEAEINTNAKNMMENKENIVNGYFDINDIINKENIAKKTILNTQNEENDYFEKRSYREKILLQLENENCIYEEDFNKMKKHFKYLEMTKSSITQEIKIKNNYLSYLEEREKEYNNKKQKALDHLEKYKHNLAHNIEEKLIIIEKIENFENIRIKENEKINDISKNV